MAAQNGSLTSTDGGEAAPQGPREGRSVILCVAGSAAAVAVITWLVFHGGASVVAGIGTYIGDLIGAVTTYFFEGWARLARAHVEAATWILALPAIFALCRVYRTGKARYKGIIAAATGLAYSTAWVALSDPGCATEGFFAGIGVAFALAMFAVVVLASDHSFY